MVRREDEQRVALVVGQVDGHAGVDVAGQLLGRARAREVEHAVRKLDDRRVGLFFTHHRSLVVRACPAVAPEKALQRIKDGG
ncbi:hypothetical protein GCM10022255_077450 [Dactylosporangium darangshiense]|uniref:Uncharacterized protein n=1 Tax=Dactylosporangium darangshiense TaxID=579108 RepID=A0ABP8DKK4_9ACTN